MSNRYHEFFIESLEGQEYLKSLETSILGLYKKAETAPELSRDFVQRAVGIRKAIDLAHTMSSTSKKGKTVED